MHNGVSTGILSARFHNTFINVLFAMACQIRKEAGLEKVVLSGGTFQNKYILSRIEKKLAGEGFSVFAQEKIPTNDGGIALGQLAIAAKRRSPGPSERRKKSPSSITNH